MSIEQLDQIIALTERLVNQVGVWLVGGRCRGCGVSCLPPKGATIGEIVHPATCPIQKHAALLSWAKGERAKLLVAK